MDVVTKTKTRFLEAHTVYLVTGVTDMYFHLSMAVIIIGKDKQFLYYHSPLAPHRVRFAPQNRPTESADCNYEVVKQFVSESKPLTEEERLLFDLLPDFHNCELPR